MITASPHTYRSSQLLSPYEYVQAVPYVQQQYGYAQAHHHTWYVQQQHGYVQAVQQQQQYRSGYKGSTTGI